eukprot:TRINITY_DN34205_c0_g1_i1.p1 TRINITY_DN34205_c0_g1~~TRINITY_DN34205_c0_g1_i1.p1  ORF type:complete len:194 (-),score=24.04 TRINITY_DN34205_c0_g1_i1:92-673(-)
MLQRLLVGGALVPSVNAIRQTLHAADTETKQEEVSCPSGDPGWSEFGLVTYDESGCPSTCGGLPIQSLAGNDTFAVGCAVGSTLEASAPECPVVDGMEQAGGHAGTFHKLDGGRIAKMTHAFEALGPDVKEKDICNARIELKAYCFLPPLPCGRQHSQRAWRRRRTFSCCVSSKDVRYLCQGVAKVLMQSASV